MGEHLCSRTSGRADVGFGTELVALGILERCRWKPNGDKTSILPILSAIDMSYSELPCKGSNCQTSSKSYVDPKLFGHVTATTRKLRNSYPSHTPIR